LGRICMTCRRLRSKSTRGLLPPPNAASPKAKPGERKLPVCRFDAPCMKNFKRCIRRRPFRPLGLVLIVVVVVWLLGGGEIRLIASIA